MKILWKGPTDMSGYGRAGLGYLQSLDFHGMKVKYVRYNRSMSLAGKGISKSETEFLRRLERNVVPQNSVYIQHNLPNLFDSYGMTARIGFSVFEFDRIPHFWVKPCNKLDELWTPAQYSKAAFVNGGVPEEKVHIIPHAIDCDFFRPGLESLSSPSNRRGFNFVSNFDFTSRKNWRMLLRGFWTAFSNKDDVTLCLKTFFLGFQEDQINKMKEMIKNYKQDCGFTNTAPILLYPHPLDSDLMPNFYNTFDCYVAMGREGFGLPFAEAMACELPAIGPGHGGNTLFMNPYNSLLVNFLGYEKADIETISREPQFEGLEWAVYDFDDLVEKMRYAYDNPKNMKELGKRGRETIKQILSFEEVGNLMKKRLEVWKV